MNLPHHFTYLKRFHTRFYGISALVIILAATLLRVALILLGWPKTNSDEATMQLMALHIAYHGEHPIFFYGQNYMGAIEAYIGAAAFRLFGASVVTMRLSLLPWFALFLLCIYWLTTRLYSKRWALVTVILLSLGSDVVFIHQLESIGGYPELNAMGALVLLISYRLAFMHDQRTGRWRWLLYIAWGLVVGLALWDDLLIAPYLLAAGILLVVCCWREILRGAIVAMLLGLIMGAWPLIYYNLHALPGQDSLSVFLQLNQMGANAQIPFKVHIIGSVVISLPAATGYSSGCFVQELPLWSPTVHTHPLYCIALQGQWGIGFIALLVIASLLAIIALWPILRQARPRNWSFEQKQEVVRHFARLLLLLGAGLTLFFYMRGPAGTFGQTTNSRYLVCLFISVPALLWPLWYESGTINMKFSVRVERIGLFARLAILLIIGVVLLQGTITLSREIPEAQAYIQQTQGLSTTLSRMGITRIYSEYWTCGRLIFATQEHVICSNLDNNLTPYWDRYQPYRDIVWSDAHPGFVFPVGMPQVANLDALIKSSHVQCQRVEVDGYVIYKPAKPLPLPWHQP